MVSMAATLPPIPMYGNLNGPEEEEESDENPENFSEDEDQTQTQTPTPVTTQTKSKPQAHLAANPARSKHNQAMSRLLPQATNLAWFVDLEQPETMCNMVHFVKPFHDQITIYATDKRRLVKTRSGEEVVAGFRGLCIDAMDTSHVCMTIARLSAAVCIDYEAGSDMDALPSALAADEAAVTVDMNTLFTVLKDVKANETMVMYMEENSSRLSVAVSDAGGETCSENLQTKPTPESHDIMGELEYEYELSVPLNPLKTFIRRAGDLKADVIKITFHEITPEVRVMCFYAEGDDADMFRVLPVGNVKDLKDLANEDDDDAEGGGEMGTEIFREIEKVATLKGVTRSIHIMTPDDKVKIPVRPEDLKKHKLLYSSSFAHRYLNLMISPLSGAAQLSMFLGESTTPLLMRFDLGKSDSYVAFALAARLDEDDA